MALHVILGAGVLGSATALELVQRGHQVRLISRSGSGPGSSGIERVATDAANPERLLDTALGAAALYNCANPPYHRWTSDWPPLAASVLEVAERTGAVLVTMSNLYGYGPLDHPTTERDALAATGRKGRVRATMWNDALAAHHAGRVNVTEARAADYFGPQVRDQGHIGARTIPPVLAGRPVRVFGNPDMPHSWTYVPDIAAPLVTLGTDPRAWGRAWHVPTNPPMTQREMLSAIAQIAGAPQPRLQTVPGWLFLAGGVVIPFLRELDEVRYQFERSFVMDSTDYETTFGVQPTPLQDALKATTNWWLAQQRGAAA